MLKIFNTLTKQKEKFVPISSGIVNIYVCGVTVYDICHIGHGRTFIIFDIVVRYLRYSGYIVNYVRNITDIDDKIIINANKNNENIKEFTNRMIFEMHNDFNSLGILKPNYEPKVTEFIHYIIELINILLKKKHAYIANNGDVMFSINSISNYGLLSRQNIKKLFTHIDTETFHFKENPIDFVLWKKLSINEYNWNSPWGFGRPGWHIECSAMSHYYLGDNIDIHGGGLDLLFPHHENELIQSKYGYNNYQVNIWMHSGMVTVDNNKMSKSLKNFVTIRYLLKHYHPEVIRYFLISSHYRNPIKYSIKNIESAKLGLERLYLSVLNCNLNVEPVVGKHFIKQFIKEMNNDFNTPGACAVLFKIAHEINNLKVNNLSAAQSMSVTLRYLANTLGLLCQSSNDFLRSNITALKSFNEEDIKHLIKLRNDARKKKQWELADSIRYKLSSMGILVEDRINGSTWKYNK